jgi:hypothetical protein
MKYNAIIPLGEACSTAIMLNEMGLRPISLPFDWLAYQTPRNLINTISNDFKNFFPTELGINKEYVRKKDIYEGLFKEIDEGFSAPNKHFPSGAPPFCDFFNIDDIDKSKVIDKWLDIKARSLAFGIQTIEDFLREFKFRNYFLNEERGDFVFTNHYKAECMHDFKSSDLSSGKISPLSYKNVFNTKKKRVNRLIDLLKKDNFLALHVSDTFFIDKKNERFSDMLGLARILTERYSISNFKILCFNLLPHDHKEGNVFNFFEPWDLYKDSCQQQRNFAKNILLKELE